MEADQGELVVVHEGGANTLVLLKMMTAALNLHVLRDATSAGVGRMCSGSLLCRASTAPLLHRIEQSANCGQVVLR
jgi:hypothetical protein